MIFKDCKIPSVKGKLKTLILCLKSFQEFRSCDKLVTPVHGLPQNKMEDATG